MRPAPAVSYIPRMFVIACVPTGESHYDPNNLFQIDQNIQPA